MRSGLSDFRRSRSMSFSMFSRIAYLHARWQISVMSAPEKPFVCLASVSRSRSSARGDLRRFALKMFRRDPSSGRGMYSSWSRRPGRRSAESMMSGRFVAPMMNTVFFAFMPSISVSIWFSTRSAALPGDRVDLVEEEHAGRRLARLVEDLAHVRLGLAEPHREQLRTLDADEVRLALVRNRLGEERLAAPGRAVEEHALARGHAKLLELLRVLDGVLHNLLELALDALQAADVLPRGVGHLDDRLAERGRVGRPERGGEVVV